MTTNNSQNLRVLADPVPGQNDILTDQAISFLTDLVREFQPRLQQLLADRKARQQQIDAGALPDFEADTAPIRDGNWKVAELPADLQKRRWKLPPG